MQIQNINNQNFQGINIANRKIMDRLSATNQRYLKFLELCKTQDINSFGIELSLGKYNNIKGKIVDIDGRILYERNENIISAFLKMSPIRFLKKLCKVADRFNRIKKKTD